MNHRWMTCVVSTALMLSSGCGCQSRTIESADGAAVSGTGAPAAGTNTAPPGPNGGPVGPTIPGAIDGPALPAGELNDPTPKSYIDVIEAMAPPLERETIADLAKDLDAKLARNAEDPVALCARVTIAAREALHAVRNPQVGPDLTVVKGLLDRAAKAAGDGQWAYLVAHQRASQARLENKAQDAVDHLKEAIKLQPAFVIGHIEYYQMMLMGGKYAEAEGKLQTLAKQTPGEWQVWFTLSRCLLAQQKMSPATGALSEALKLRPDMLLLHEAMLRSDSQAFQQKKDEQTEIAVRARFDLIEKAAEKHFKHEANLKRYKNSIDVMRLQFERSRSALLVVDFDLLPAERRTYTSLLGRLSRPEMRQGIVRGVAAGLASSEEPQARACFLLDVIRLDPSDKVRVDAIRGFHFNLGLRAPRPWKRGERKMIAALCEDDLTRFVETLDPAQDRTVRLPIYHALGALPASSLSCGPELVARVAAIAPPAMPLITEQIARQTELDTLKALLRKTKKDEITAEQRAKVAALTATLDDVGAKLDPLIEELQVLNIALREIRSLGAPNIGRWIDPAQIQTWLDNWVAWSNAIIATRTGDNWVRPETCK